MIKNYIKVALRNIIRYPTYAGINIIGLSIGIVCSLLLLLFILDELSYDSQHKNSDRIYRVVSHIKTLDTELTLATSMPPMGPTLHNDYSEVESFLRIKNNGELLVMSGQNKFYEDKIYTVDSTFFDFFDFNLINGDRKTCLVEPNSIVISETLALKYFANENPIGKTLKTGGDETPRRVTGVMQDPESNSHIHPNGLISYSSLPRMGQIEWGNLNDYTYILLPKSYNIDLFQKNFEVVNERHIRPLFEQFNAQANFILQPLSSIHLHSKLEGEIEPTGDIYYIYIFGAISVFMLIIASINYMNLATARSANRSREVGIRKAMGSYKLQLIGQFMSESIVITLLAVVISSILVFFLIPSFNELTGKNLSLDFLTNPIVVLVLLGIVVLVGLVGGSYPSFFLANFDPSEVLKGKYSGKRGNAQLRKILVITQFSISLVMVISTWVVFDQLQYLKNKELGFNKDRVLRIALNGPQATQKYEVLKNAMLAYPNIEAIGSGRSTPGGNNLSMNGISVESEDGMMIEKVFQTIYIDNEYLNTLEIPLVSGRNFSRNVQLDTSQSVIVNEEMVKHMGWENPIGKKFGVIVNENLEMKSMHVVGVIKDFHLRALKEPILPVVVRNTVENDNMLVRLKPEDISGTIKFMEKSWSEIISNRPFEYNFIEQDFNEQYEADQKRGEVFGVFAIFTIMISCLGLFGLASFTAESRRKEIGIRKVVGASVSGIVLMMSFEFLKLVLAAVLIAFPVAYVIMGQWLEEFAFRMEMSPISFLLSTLLTLLIAFVTVSYHSITSATSNPSNALRE